VKLYWSPHPCAIGSHVVLEAGAIYETEKLDGGGATHEPRFLSVNSKGKASTLVRDDARERAQSRSARGAARGRVRVIGLGAISFVAQRSQPAMHWVVPVANVPRHRYSERPEIGSGLHGYINN